MTPAAGRPDNPPAQPPPASPPPRRARFAALGSRNFRLFLLGYAVVTTGLWVQRIAQDWLVLDLTGSASAVGVTTALQWAPMLAFSLVGGWIADRYPKRKVLQVTQIAASLLAASLAALTLTGHVTAWHVQLMAAAIGTLAAIETPVRSAFVTDLVEHNQIRSAVSLSYSVFYLGNFAGPAISGLLITVVGPGWAFALNALSYTASLTALALIKSDKPRRTHPATLATTPTSDGLRTLVRKPGIWRPTVLAAAFGMFTFNVPVTLATYARTAGTGPGGYALLTSAVALGSVFGGLIAAGRGPTTLRGLTRTGYTLALVYVVAAAMPTPWSFSGALAAIGIVATLLLTGTNAAVQLAAGKTHRGRVMSVYLLVVTGSAAFGSLLLGTINEHLGPRTGLLLAGVVPATAISIMSITLFAYRRASPAPSRAHRPCQPGRSQQPPPTPPLPAAANPARTPQRARPATGSARDCHQRPTSASDPVSSPSVSPGGPRRGASPSSRGDAATPTHSTQYRHRR
ncbi:MFS transporter [Rhodococcus koreensis]|uniref:MFS transporter n=1 Tax=Rhodococcus koreensis TaxID=99653 RepID=UPI00366C44A5